MPTSPRCRAKNPLTCREHGRVYAQELLLPGDVTRDFGLTGQSLAAYVADSEALEAQFDMTDHGAVGYYTGIGYSYINGWLRNGREGLIDAEIHDNFHHQNTPENRAKAAQEIADLEEPTRRRVAELDRAFEKSSAFDKPRVLYKAFRVRSDTGSDKTSAAEIKAYIQQHYRRGNIVRNKAYTSTSLDPDYMLVHARRRPSQVIVQEIITSRGLPLHLDMPGSIQSAEREVLLPRDMKFEVVNVIRANFEYTGLGPAVNHWGLTVPKRKQFVVVQLREID